MLNLKYFKKLFCPSKREVSPRSFSHIETGVVAIKIGPVVFGIRWNSYGGPVARATTDRKRSKFYGPVVFCNEISDSRLILDVLNWNINANNVTYGSIKPGREPFNRDGLS